MCVCIGAIKRIFSFIFPSIFPHLILSYCYCLNTWGILKCTNECQQQQQLKQLWLWLPVCLPACIVACMHVPVCLLDYNAITTIHLKNKFILLNVFVVFMHVLPYFFFFCKDINICTGVCVYLCVLLQQMWVFYKLFTADNLFCL